MASINVEAFLGSFFILVCFVLMLFGLLCAQVIYYYTTYKDHNALRGLVLVLCVLEAVHVMTCIHIFYIYLIVDYANPVQLDKIIWSVGLIAYLEHTINPLVQSFYIYRIWCVSQNRSVLLVLAALELARIGIGFRSSSYMFIYHTWEDLASANSFTVILNLAFGFNVFVDFSIAFILTYFYNKKSRSSAHARSTKKILLHLTYYAVTAGALTVLGSILVLITYNTSSSTLTWCGFLQIVVKLNANAMLAMLNGRRRIVRGAGSNNGMSLELSRLSNRPSQPETAIHVLKETIISDNKWDDGKEHTKCSQSSDLSKTPTHVELAEA